jgi:hypothetical protein
MMVNEINLSVLVSVGPLDKGNFLGTWHAVPDAKQRFVIILVVQEWVISKVTNTTSIHSV